MSGPSPRYAMSAAGRTVPVIISFICPKCHRTGTVRWRHHRPGEQKASELEALTEGFKCRQVSNHPAVIECSTCKIEVRIDD